jgi:dephospho-CoA kinase
MMIRVGLTGGIGSGKTTVSGIFERLGVPVFYADLVAKELMFKDRDLRSHITALLGKRAYKKSGLNTEYIAGRIFRDTDLLNKVNSYVHPAVYRYFLEWCDDFIDKAYVVHEAAVILEGGWRNMFDHIILVSAPGKLRIERVVRRDAVSEDKVLERMKNQLPEEEKVKQADFIIDNGLNSMILPQILSIHNKFMVTGN